VAESLNDRLIGRMGWLDGIGELVQSMIGGIYGALGRPGRTLEDLLHGTWPLGHPLHAALADVPLGAWLVAIVADWAAIATHAVPSAAGDLALLVGVIGAVAAAAAGYTDHRGTVGHERRVATLHGMTMSAVTAVLVVSLGLRWWAGPGLHVTAVVLSTLAVLVALYGAYLGGHLVFGLGTMVNRNAFTEAPSEFVAVGPSEEFPEGDLRRVQAGAMPALVVRQRGRLRAIGATCSHAGGPLDEGSVEGDIVTCPWHGSRFCLADGAVRGGPATFAQPAFEVRERAGLVELRAAAPED
jgi:nitrite reductase/ring-hydroxylating ferredoxin subunit/fluoride ion exporter CrcB/FEX